MSRSVLLRRTTGVVLALMIGAALAVVAPSIAYAKGEYKTWNSASNPLVASGYGSKAYGYGQWRVADGSSGTRSYFDARVKYSNADNHTKYGKFTTQTNAGICVAPEYTSCTASYYSWASAATAHSNVAGYQWLYANTSLNSSGNYARALAYVCLDIPLRTDVCTGPTYTGVTSY